MDPEIRMIAGISIYVVIVCCMVSQCPKHISQERLLRGANFLKVTFHLRNKKSE